MFYLLRNYQGEAILMAQAGCKAEADAFGRANLTDFCGESLEIQAQNCAEAEATWHVPTVQVTGATTMQGGTVVKAKKRTAAITFTHVWVHGLELPEEVIADDLLTPEDHRDLALDHVARTSEYIGHIEIRKWAGRRS